MDFRYLGQAPELDDTDCQAMLSALALFHEHKHAIIEAGARVGKKNRPIRHWSIPKLEFLQSVVPNIMANGAPIQWSADVTEHAHITEVKIPAKASNNQNYEAQICRHLDRIDKCRRFDLATCIRGAEIDFRAPSSTLDPDEDNSGYASDESLDIDAPCVSSSSELLDILKATSGSQQKRNGIPDHFLKAKQLQKGDFPTAPIPYRFFTDASLSAAFHITRKSTFKLMTIDEVAFKFDIPDLRAALSDYLSRYQGMQPLSIGGRRSAAANCELPFDKLRVWPKVQIQSRSFHRQDILQPRTAFASPPMDTWPMGRHNAVIVNTDTVQKWPQSGLKGNISYNLNCSLANNIFDRSLRC
jgi:hypothetical protein